MSEAHTHRIPAAEAAAQAREASNQEPADRREPTLPLADIAFPLRTTDVSALLRQAAQRLHDETAARDRTERSRETPSPAPAGREQQAARKTERAVVHADVREQQAARSPERTARGWGQSWAEQAHEQTRGRQ